MDLLEDMRRDDHDLVPGQPADHFTHLVFLIGIEPIGRLVQDQHQRIVQDRLGQTDTTFETLGQGLDGLLGHTLQVHRRDHVLHTGIALGSTEAAHFGNEAQESGHAHVFIARRALGEVANQALRLERILGHIPTADPHRTRARRDKAGNHFHRGRFAGAVGAEKAQHLPRAHRETELANGFDPSEVLAELGDFDHADSPDTAVGKARRTIAALRGPGNRLAVAAPGASVSISLLRGARASIVPLAATKPAYPQLASLGE